MKSEKTGTQQDPTAVRLKHELNLAHEAALKDDVAETRRVAEEKRRAQEAAAEEARVAGLLTVAKQLDPTFILAGFKSFKKTTGSWRDLGYWEKTYQNTRAKVSEKVELTERRTSGWHSRPTGELKLTTNLDYSRRNYSVKSAVKVIGIVERYIQTKVAVMKEVKTNGALLKEASLAVGRIMRKEMPDFMLIEDASKLVPGTWYAKQADDCYRDYRGVYKVCESNAKTVVITIRTTSSTITLRVDTETLKVTKHVVVVDSDEVDSSFARVVGTIAKEVA